MGLLGGWVYWVIGIWATGLQVITGLLGLG